MAPRNPQCGTGLIEALIATAIVVTSLGILAGLASVALRTVMATRDRSLAVVHAHSKLDVLRSAPAEPPVSPPGTLEHDVPGWVEYLDAAGRVRGADAGHRGTVFVRRWRNALVDGQPGLFLITVSMGRCAGSHQPSEPCGMPADAVVVSGVRSSLVW